MVLVLSTKVEESMMMLKDKRKTLTFHTILEP